MLVTVVAHPQNEYAAWAKTAVEEAARATSPETKAGRDAFLAGPCAGCHTVKGTTAAGKIGPELTHIASKANIARALSPGNQENLTKWIHNAPSFKPRTLMPKFDGGLPAQPIDQIVQWLLTLQ